MAEIEITDALLDEIEAKAEAVIYSDPYGPKKWSAVDDFSSLISPATALSLVARIRELEAKVKVSMKTAWAKSMELGRRDALEEAASVVDEYGADANHATNVWASGIAADIRALKGNGLEE